MDRATVPEAAVDENSDVLAREDDVRAAATTERCEVYAIAEPGRVQQSTDGKLG